MDHEERWPRDVYPPGSLIYDNDRPLFRPTPEPVEEPIHPHTDECDECGEYEPVRELTLTGTRLLCARCNEENHHT